MPAQRATRGSYAKYICSHCRKRKIKCILPQDVEIQPSRQAQPEATSCQRCVLKGLDCVVNFTILGRPSHANDSSMTRVTTSSRSSHRLSLTDSAQDRLFDGPDTFAREDHDDDHSNNVDDYLIVRPQRTSDSRDREPPPKRQRPHPADKFQAMTSPAYLLSTLLQRDRQFASRLPQKAAGNVRVELGNLINPDSLPALDQHLVWHRLYYPDIPSVAELYEGLIQLESQDPEYLPVAFLYVLLCLLALEMPSKNFSPTVILKESLDRLLLDYGQRVLFTLPEHRYAMLGLELMTEYRPLALVTGKFLASGAVRARIVPPLLKEIALNINLHAAPDKLRRQLQPSSAELNLELLHDCLKWYRLCLRDDVLAGEGRSSEKRKMMGQTVEEAMHLLETLLNSGRVPHSMLLAFHSLLCQASKLEYMLRIKEHWNDLESLGISIDNHKNACQYQRQLLKNAIQNCSSLRPGEAVAMTQLLDAQLHSAYCWVSGSATFYCVMAGSQASVSSKELHAEQAMDVSDQIIERFAEPTRHLHASDAHTDFLVKYGSKRMDDLELTLLNFISAFDSLKLDGIPYIPPVGHATSHILYNVKDVMEGQAARMKGWGGLHERAHMHLLLIRNCAASLERIGGMVTGCIGNQAVERGCLWAATARLLRSLHRLLAEWQEWNTLGQAKVSIPSRRVKDDAASGQGFSGMDDVGLLPDDLFFDWNMWLSEADNVMPLE